MRIIFFTTKFDFEKGGGSTPELDLKIKSLQALGHTVEAVTLFSQNNRGDLPSAYPVREEYIGTSGQLKIQWGAYRMLKKHEVEADLFHVDGVVFLYAAGLYRLLGGRTPVVAHCNREQSSFPESRTDASEEVSFGRTFKKLRRRIRFLFERVLGVFLANRADLFTFTSPLLKRLYNRFGLDENRSVVVRDFVDGTVVPTHERTHSKAFTILCSGRMIREKGFDLVVHALAELPEKNSVRTVLSGDGPELSALQSLARELRVEEQVMFPGWVPKEKLFEFLKAADVFILPRWRPELASMLLFEAMSFGIPCVVPGEGTLAWSAGAGALTFEDENPADLAKQIARLQRDGTLRRELSEKARKRLLEIDYRSAAKELSALLQGVVKKTKS